MATNLIQNAAFSQGLTNWLQYTWYPDNTVCALSSGGHNGACVKLTVRSIGDPGQSYIYQPVHLTGGESYTLSFYAKRTGNVDIWAQVSSAHGTHYSPSFIPTLSQDGAYTKLSFSFTADGNSGDTVSTTIKLIAGSAGGDAWFDTVELVADSDGGTNDTSIGNYAKIKSTVSGFVNIRDGASVSTQRKGRWKANSMFYITGISGDWRKIRFGKPHTPHAIGGEAWINGDFIEAAYAGNSFVDRYCNIAKSFAGQEGAIAFEYTHEYGKWCQAFLLNMAIMAGLANSSLTLPCETSNGTNANIWSAYQWMETNGTVSTSLATCPIKKGDWLYYKSGNDNMSHVGLIVDVTGRQVKRVEGNITEDGKKIVKYYDTWETLDQIPDAYAIAHNW